MVKQTFFNGNYKVYCDDNPNVPVYLSSSSDPAQSPIGKLPFQIFPRTFADTTHVQLFLQDITPLP